MVEMNYVQMDEPGHPKFIFDHDGYIYRCTKKMEFKTYLICQKKSKFNCKGTAVIENGLLHKNKPRTCLCEPQEVS